MFSFFKDYIRFIRLNTLRGIAFSRATKMKLEAPVLIVAPHPDDEIIGCSGLMQSLLKAKKEVYVVILTGGEGAHKGCCALSAVDLISTRRNLAVTINTKIGIKRKHLFFLDYEDGNVHYDCQETKKLAGVIKKVQPSVIFIPHNREGWNDHLQAGNIIRRLLEQDINTQLYEYCVWFWYYNIWKIDWKRAYLLSMDKDEHSLKNEAMDMYIKPQAPCGTPWSGVLPKSFIKANRWNKELYFRIK